jgi:hypothetical protein
MCTFVHELERVCSVATVCVHMCTCSCVCMCVCLCAHSPLPPPPPPQTKLCTFTRLPACYLPSIVLCPAPYSLASSLATYPQSHSALQHIHCLLPTLNCFMPCTPGVEVGVHVRVDDLAQLLDVCHSEHTERGGGRRQETNIVAEGSTCHTLLPNGCI